MRGSFPGNKKLLDDDDDDDDFVAAAAAAAVGGGGGRVIWVSGRRSLVFLSSPPPSYSSSCYTHQSPRLLLLVFSTPSYQTKIPKKLPGMIGAFVSREKRLRNAALAIISSSELPN